MGQGALWLTLFSLSCLPRPPFPRAQDGHIVGIEILDASEKMNTSDLVNIAIENLPLERVA
jgi:hypothetical protein